MCDFKEFLGIQNENDKEKIPKKVFSIQNLEKGEEETASYKRR